MLNHALHIVAIILVLVALKHSVERAYAVARKDGSTTEAGLFAGVILIATIWAAVHLGLRM